MERNRRSGAGCGTVAIVLIVLAVFAAWYFGAFSRLTYLFQMEASKPAQSESIEHVSDVREDSYVFSQLSSDDQEKYLILLDSFRSREGRTYPETDMDDLARIRDCVLADHPELFFISGVQIKTTSNLGSGLVTSVVVEGQYTFSAEEVAMLQPQIEAIAAECLASAPSDADDYGKAKYLYEYLVANVEYDHDIVLDDAGALDKSSGQTIVDALVNRQAVCAGYARAYQYLLGQLGVPCLYVTGVANGGGHAWCVAFLDGRWYHIDPTWGDPQFLVEDGEAVGDFGRISYDYLCVTDEDIAATHVPDCPYPLPACTSIDDNYYVREGLYLTAADLDWAGSILEEAVANGELQARFRCANRDIFDQIVELLFDDQEIYRFIPGDSCRYLLGYVLCTVEVVFD